MADIITPEISDRICNHMNEDHADAVLLYARAFGGVTDASGATMLAIDPQGMDLMTRSESGSEAPIRISFDHTLQDSEDAHQTLIAMVRQARTQAK